MKIRTITTVTLVLALCLLFTCGCTTTTFLKLDESPEYSIRDILNSTKIAD
ncbi:hypothetical protein [Methanocalculus sp.]|uniref:hypothetical protein n=1 Tax=Methanocalculus sp. TaxID=2004547 RepID=UPI002717157B|nr:hypothetical protein [Methanocalculus sp.]MDO8842624.1 hypothetical protein [Methanocalculus sp.]